MSSQDKLMPTRAAELLANGSRDEQADVVAAFLDLEGWPTYAEIVRSLAARPTTDASTLDLSLGISRIECEHGYDVCPICDEPDISTDVLVAASIASPPYHPKESVLVRKDDLRDLLAERAALQRSNAEMREALAYAESILTAVSSAGAGEALNRVRKAISHSSEQSND